MSDQPFTKENMDRYLKELAKEFRKRNGKRMPAEIILVGGAAILANYGFREMTYDMDAIIQASSAMKDAVISVRDKYDLPLGWINTDFMKSASYSPKINQFSKYYKTFSNIVSIRVVTREYLIAMKMKSGRLYKYDISDIIGILNEEEKRSTPVSLEEIRRAAIELYGSYESIPIQTRQIVEKAIAEGDYGTHYLSVRETEADNRERLIQFQQEYPGVTTRDNVNEIIAMINKKQNK